MKVDFKKIHPDAHLPYFANPGDAGGDIVAIGKEWDEKNEVLTFRTGLAVKIPEGYVGFLMPRSSIYKTGLNLCNSCGVIDSGYTGELLFKFYPGNRPKKNYELGDRIGQLVIVPYLQFEPNQVEELPKTQRGTGGWGSSGS